LQACGLSRGGYPQSYPQRLWISKKALKKRLLSVQKVFEWQQ
jgi:hypothetical protein